jgi:HEAT repeat protein
MTVIAESRVANLIRRLKHDDPIVRVHAGFALGDIGPAAHPAVPTLLELLTGENVQDRRLAAVTLGGIAQGAAAAVPVLRNARKDADAVVARFAEAALEKIVATGGQARAA